MANIANPYAATIPKNTSGLSDTISHSSVYKFMGASVVSTNLQIGFNSTASSLSLTLVEDTVNGDIFLEPSVPSVHAFSLPKGGVGAPIFVNNDHNFHQEDFAGANVPFYFCGICTSWSKNEIDTSGKTITVSLVDPRELLRGVQCLMSGFALSHNVGDGSIRYDNVKNVMDLFGFFANGYESGKNEYGMTWAKVKQAIESIGVTVNGINFEFMFTGNEFNNVPDYYRVNETIIDIVSLVQKVCDDGGSDLLVIARKTSSLAALIEFRCIRRSNVSVLYKTQLAAFISARSSIVESARVGIESKNEAESPIILGGMKNSNYIAWPSEYLNAIHLNDQNNEDYNRFPDDIKTRLFGGTYTRYNAPTTGEALTNSQEDITVRSGSIFPFWGFSPDDQAWPFIEPFLPLDHLVFDADSSYYLQLKARTPLCKISQKNFTVRVFPHTQVFLDGDADSDDRPFAYLEEYKLGSSDISGYIRGLPLNTEILRASMSGAEAFFSIYGLYYPDIAASLGFPKPDWKKLKDCVNNTIARGEFLDPNNFSILNFLWTIQDVEDFTEELVIDSKGRVSKNDINSLDATKALLLQNGLNKFTLIIYELVRQYALDHMGRKFMVCLPKSNIMQRIWNNLPVPTRTERPEIEYIVDQRGYWETLPNEFDGINDDGTVATGSPEDQIRRKFAADDGRFYPMAVIDWKPYGNVNFNSNGYNKAMFQDLPVSEFRPNKIAGANPEYVCISCNVNQLPKRPDLALVELPAAIQFDPTDSYDFVNGIDLSLIDDEFVAKKGGIFKYFWKFLHKNDDLRSAIKSIATANSDSFTNMATKIIKGWSNEVFQLYGSLWFQRSDSTEFIMDLKAVFIPLTSTWVSYGPWYYNHDTVRGATKIEIDNGLVPWNFDRPANNQAWDYNLEIAGQERLSRSHSYVEYLDSATVVVAGFPEFSLADPLGYNSNITSLSVDFGIGGVKTTYNLATYDARPGTYRKSDYDDLQVARLDSREKLPDPLNENLLYIPNYSGTNRFKD